MTTDVEQGNFLLGELECEHHTVGIGDPNRPTPTQLPTQWVQAQLGVEWVGFEPTQHITNNFREVTMSFEELS